MKINITNASNKHTRRSPLGVTEGAVGDDATVWSKQNSCSIKMFNFFHTSYFDFFKI